MKTWQRIGLIIFIFAMISRCITASPAHAQVRDSSDYQLTVSQPAETSTYGENVTFKALLVHPATGFSLSLNQWFLSLDGKEIDGFLFSQAYDSTSTSTLLTYTAANLNPGVYTVSSIFQPQGSSIVITSNVIMHTVQKATPGLACAITGENSLNFSPGHQTHLHMTLIGVDTNYQDGTFTITFIGSTTITESNITPEPGLLVPITVPTTPSKYDVRCSYNGSSLFNPAQYDYGFITVSAQHPISGIQVYSSIAHFVPNQAITLYVVLHGTAGLPPPTGIIALTIGSEHTSAIQLSGSGDATIQTTLPSLISSTDPLGVYYYGNSNYSVTSINFSPPFAPLPSQTGSPQPVTVSTPTKTPSPSSGSGYPPVTAATGIPTESSPTLSETVTVTPGTLAIASSPQSPTTSTTHTARSGDATMWIILILAFLVLSVSGGVYLYLHRHRIPQIPPIATAAPDTSIFTNDEMN